MNEDILQPEQQEDLNYGEEDFSDSGQIPNQQLTRDNTPELLKGLISNEEYPEVLQDDFKFIFNKDIVLSFQDETSKRNKLIDFDILKIDTLMGMSYHEYDFKLERRFNQLKIILETKLERAKGFDNTKKINERIVQQTQFSESKNVKAAEASNEGNFLTRMLGRK
jgi:hypothetical protein